MEYKYPGGEYIIKRQFHETSSRLWNHMKRISFHEISIFLSFKKFPRDHDQIFAGSRPAALLLALILLPLSYVLGAFAATVIPSVPASADGNWGLSFQQEGKPPVANATADELKQYNAWYADLSGEKVIYLTFDAGYENGNTPMILDALKKHQVPAAFSSSETTWRPARTS